jgi:hypothetical protein
MDFIRNANAMKGSVNDTWTDSLVRAILGRVPGAAQMTQGPFHSAGGIDQAAGGTTGMVGVVQNEAHPAYQWLLKNFPREARNLKRMPGITRYENVDPVELARAGNINAVTNAITPAVVARYPQGVRGSDVTASTLENLAATPGSTIQWYPRSGIPESQTPLHEAAHALRRGRSGGTEGTPTFTPQQIEEAARRGQQGGMEAGQYGGDIHHRALDFWARIRAGS